MNKHKINAQERQRKSKAFQKDSESLNPLENQPLQKNIFNNHPKIWCRTRTLGEKPSILSNFRSCLTSIVPRYEEAYQTILNSYLHHLSTKKSKSKPQRQSPPSPRRQKKKKRAVVKSRRRSSLWRSWGLAPCFGK